MNDIRERLRATRELAGDLSARELGRLAGVAKTYPALIESGVRKQIGSEVVSKLAAVLGVSTDFLILGTGKPPTALQVARAVSNARESMRPIGKAV